MGKQVTPKPNTMHTADKKEEQMVQELLKPRYKIENIWPDMGDRQHYHGELIVLDSVSRNEPCVHRNGQTLYQGYFALYPHLFKPLAWWEERGQKELPKYVKIAHPIDNKNRVAKARFPKNETSKYCMFLDDEIIPYDPAYFVPATLTDYTQFIEQSKK